MSRFLTGKPLHRLPAFFFFTAWMTILPGLGFPFDHVSPQDQATIRKPDLLQQEWSC
jgi:hypothetical protein